MPLLALTSAWTTVASLIRKRPEAFRIRTLRPSTVFASSSVRATRAASEDEQFELAAPRLQALLREGVCAIEIKSGYGLSLAHERAQNLGLPYQGALTPAESWQVLQLAPGAKLVDVRTRAELDWVGRVPGAVELEWKSYPSMQENPNFLAQLKHQVDPEALVLFMCRSGARSGCRKAGS